MWHFRKGEHHATVIRQTIVQDSDKFTKPGFAFARIFAASSASTISLERLRYAPRQYRKEERPTPILTSAPSISSPFQIPPAPHINSADCGILPSTKSMQTWPLCCIFDRFAHGPDIGSTVRFRRFGNARTMRGLWAWVRPPEDAWRLGLIEMWAACDPLNR